MAKIEWADVTESFEMHKGKLMGLLGLVLFGLVLWLFSYQESCSWERGVKRDKEAIKKEVNALANIEKEIANLESKREAKKEEIKEAANGHADAINASDAQRENINAAVNRMQEAVNANRGNVNAGDFDRLLDQLEGNR